MLAINKIDKAIRSLENAKEKLEEGNLRLAVCDLDFSKDYLQASLFLLLAEIEEGENDTHR